MLLKNTLLILLFLSYTNFSLATDYYFHPKIGNDSNGGLSSVNPFKSLAKAATLDLYPGDVLFFAADQTFYGSLKLNGVAGTRTRPIVVKSYHWNPFAEEKKAKIDAKGHANGVSLINCSHIVVEQLEIEANGGTVAPSEKMRCGVLVLLTESGTKENIILNNLKVHHIYYNEEGFERGTAEVKTANGTQPYGWGIRFITRSENAVLKNITVSNSTVTNVAHTGIKFTARKGKIKDIKIHNSVVTKVGGPGIQLSGVHSGNIAYNTVDHSGSEDDSRKWGRGSGLWTWSCADIIIEKNRFTNANGPGDSAGCHIDFNCKNIIAQYNFSANNAGGFCEILGNNYNCAYRYNISVNDGFREKGVDGAFQEGKTFWLSGYNGRKKPIKGPYNSYFYNNTIYLQEKIMSKIAITRVADGVLIANNIFYIKGKSMLVKGDQYNPETVGKWKVQDVLFKHNLFLTSASWPSEQRLQDAAPIYGQPNFLKEGGLNIEDYIPQNSVLVKDRGIKIPRLSNDTLGLFNGLNPKEDILGNPINGLPDLGAIEIN